jgi:hypothetical protein
MGVSVSMRDGSISEEFTRWIARRDAKLAGVKEAAGKLLGSGVAEENRPSVAKAIFDSAGFVRGLKPPTPSVLSFSAACKGRRWFCGSFGASELVP